MSSGETSGISQGTNGTQGSLNQTNFEIKAKENEQRISDSSNIPIRQPRDLRFNRKKAEGYLLNKKHPQGGSKAKFIEDTLGYTKADSHKFHTAIIQAIIGKTPNQTHQTEYGIKHNFKTTILGKNGKYVRANIVVVIQKDNKRTTYKVVTVYPDRKG